jgi:hypothetical protein
MSRKPKDEGPPFYTPEGRVVARDKVSLHTAKAFGKRQALSLRLRRGVWVNASILALTERNGP